MTRAPLLVLTLALLVAHLVPARAGAQESNGTPAAKVLFAEGEAAAKAGRLAEAAAAFQKAMEIDPDFVDAHQRFIESTRRLEAPASRTPTLPRLQQLYERWARQHPKRAVYRWALGFLSHDPAKADLLFREALRIDPAFARAHVLLARNADLRGDWVAQRHHLKAAVESNPDNPEYLMRYARAHRDTERARFTELALRVVEKFPDSPSAAEALYHLARESSNPDRRAYFERLRADYPPEKFGYSSHAMSTFYSELTRPSEALSLARDMAKAIPASKTWARRVALQEAMLRAEALIGERRFGEALDVIEKTERSSGTDAVRRVLMKAEAGAGAGQLEAVYSELVESVAEVPDDRVEAEMAKYGAALQKTPEQMKADVWRIRDAKATPAAPFELTNARDGKPVRLSDYRGRVVLLAFWFPG